MQQHLAIHFAPLQGYTDAVYRNAHARIFGSVDWYYTPFVRLEKDSFRNKEVRDVNPDTNIAPVIPQLIAGTVSEFRKITTMLACYGHKQIDINLGCPFPLQVRKHRGSGLLPFPNEAQVLLNTIQEYPEIKFSVKMRLGWDQKSECMALLPYLNGLPLTHITVHPRLGIQQYKGMTDLEMFDCFYRECTHPIFYNGDIRTIEDIEIIKSRFPNLKGIMIGRGLLSDPFLAASYHAITHSPEEQQQLLHRFLSELFENYKSVLQGDHQLLTKVKTIWEYLLPDADKKLRKKIMKSTRIDQYTEAVHSLLKQYPNV